MGGAPGTLLFLLASNVLSCSDSSLEKGFSGLEGGGGGGTAFRGFVLTGGAGGFAEYGFGAVLGIAGGLDGGTGPTFGLMGGV